MGKVIEMTVWKAHPGKMKEMLAVMSATRTVFLAAGVSEIKIVVGAAGKDVGNATMIQTFKGYADNGAVNEAIGDDAGVKAHQEKYKDLNIGTFISHDIYEVIEE
ncbi:unannotated protein [freshwater metagenome]|jgi:hypothetical protein|uniref:Unannotated protein n=1 Tax=freshwater metagenome TaxID=449393 RepID=A0A6J6LMU1_9ZZZZ|nr:hypothetical protein [Actinomycetota bacterium]MSX48351.1 hypothetical protein [Actinomycetota bacterium]MSY54798.1 hypothetical protein [Actinomycetota bacterium]MTA67869.1 hypothetical protein [Actinomycetota bacterium]MTB16158.1 hypothetical protein [Actinomycetota bacterium]